MEEQEKKAPSLKSQSAWLMTAKTIGFVFSFLLPLFIYRLLTQSEAGIYKQVFLVIMSASSILPMGVSMSAFYFLSRETMRRPFYIANILLFNFLVGGLACLTLFLYPQLLGNLFQDAEMTRLAPHIGLVIWLWIFSAFLEIVAIANQEPRLATTFIVLSQLTKMLLMVTAVLVFGTVDALLNAANLQALLQTIILLGYLNSRFKGFWHSFDWKLFGAHLKYAIPFGFATILFFLQNESHNYFIGYRFSSAEMAIYAVGCFELPLLGMLYESIAAVLLPRMSQLQMEDKKREMVELAARASEKLALVYFAFYAFFLVVAEDLITTMFTKAYLASVPIFLINITLLLFYVWITDPIIRAFEHLGRFILKVRICIVICLFTTLWFGINYFDLRGMIAIVVSLAIIERTISAYKAWQTIGARWEDVGLLKNVGKIAIAAFIAGVATFLFRWEFRQFAASAANLIIENLSLTLEQHLTDSLAGIIVLASSGLLFAIVYVFLTNYFEVISDDEKQFVKNFFEKLSKPLKNIQTRTRLIR